MDTKGGAVFPRRCTRPVKVGDVIIGAGAPVVVQSMTKTDTRDVKATIAQIRRLERAGCEIVRLAVPDPEAASALREIKKKARVPLIADIHFDHRLALLSLDAGVDGLRINPGTIGSRQKVKEVVRASARRGAAVRIGVNSGSLEKDLLRKHGAATAEAMAESVLRHLRMFEDLGFFNIKLSLKASDIPRTLEAYRRLSSETDCPFHAGITEAGGLLAGGVKSAAGLALLLNEGLADTIRVSLTAGPEYEVAVAYRILRNLGLRPGGVDVISCPTCGRCKVDLLRIAAEVEKRLTSKISGPLTVAVMGCAVNGPGEAREADIGVACGKNSGVIFKRGKILRKVEERRMIEVLVDEAERFFCKTNTPAASKRVAEKGMTRT